MDIMIIGAGIILLILFILLKSTRVPTSIYKSKTIYSDHIGGRVFHSKTSLTFKFTSPVFIKV